MGLASISIDIVAKVKGWQLDLERLKAAAGKIDLGSSFGREFSKALKSLESQVDSMGKNLNLRLTSESGIDAFNTKLDNVDAKFQSIGEHLASISFDLLNPEYVIGELKLLNDLLETAKTSLNESMDSGFKSALSGAENLNKALKRIELDPSTMSLDEVKNALDGMVDSAVQKIEILNEELKELKSQLADVSAQLAQLSHIQLLKETDLGRVASTIISKNAGDYGFGQIINSEALSKIRTKLEEQIEKIKLSDEKKNEIRKYLSDLVPESSIETIRERMAQIREVLSGKTNLEGFGLDANSFKNYIQEIITSISDTSAFDNALTQMKEKFLELGISEDDMATFFEPLRNALANQDFNSAISIATSGLTKLLMVYKDKAADIARTIEELNLKINTNNSNFGKNNWNKNFAEKGLKEYELIIQDLKEQNKVKLDTIDKLLKELNDRREALVNETKLAGTDTKSKASDALKENANAARLYKTELELVLARELMIGKIQGVIQRWFSIYAAVRMVSNAVKSVISVVLELDKTITEIAIVTNMDLSQLWGLMDAYTNMAKAYAASISGVYKVSQLYYQLGLDSSSVMALTELTLKMARISGLDYADATDYMTNAVRSFKMEMTEALTVVDVYSAVAASSATSVTELATAMSKTASSAQAVGSSFLNTTAMMAVMIEATRESAENIGSAMKSIISRYGEMTSDPSKLVDSEGQEMSLNRVDAALLTVGISIHNAAGEFRNFDEVIMELAKSWDTIDTNTQRYIATIMAGNRQLSRFLALVSSYDRLKELSAEAMDAEDASLAQYLKTLDSIEAKTQLLLTSILSMYVNTGLENLYKGLLDSANNVIKTFAEMPRIFNQPIPAIIKIGSVFYSVASSITTLFGLLKYQLANKTKLITGEVVNNTVSAEDAETNALRLAIAERIAIIEQYVALRKNLIKGMTAEEAWNEARSMVLKNLNRVTLITTLLGGNNTTANSTATLSLFSKEGLKNLFTKDGLKSFFSKDNLNKLLGKGTQGAAIGSLVTNLLGSAITLAASNMGTSTQGERVGKGFATIGGGALRGAGMGFSFGGLHGAILGGAIGALTSAFEGIGIIIEDSAEKLQRLKDEATLTNNERIESVSKYNNLKSEMDLVRALAETYNDSAEAKEAYYEHSNALAEQYPNIVESYDAEGNAIINLTAAYRELKKAKEEASEKTAENNYKLIELAEEEEKLAKKDAEWAKTRYNMNRFTDSDETMYLTKQLVQAQLKDSGNKYYTSLLGLFGEGTEKVDWSQILKLILMGLIPENVRYKGFLSNLLTRALNDYLDTNELWDIFNYVDETGKHANLDKLRSEVELILDKSTKGILNWFIDTMVGASEIVLPEEGDYNEKTANLKALRLAAIADETKDRMQTKLLEAIYNNGPKVDYLSKFDDVGTIINLSINKMLEAAAKDAEKNGKKFDIKEYMESDEVDKAYQKLFRDLLTFWNSLDPTELTEFNKLLKSRKTLNRTLFEDSIKKWPKLIDSTTHQLYTWVDVLFDYYTDAFDFDKLLSALDARKENKNNNEVFDQLINTHKGIIKSLGETETYKILSVYDKLNKYVTSDTISQENARNIFDAYIKSFDKLTEEVQKILTDLDIFSFGDINAAIQLLDGDEFADDKNVGDAIDLLKTLSHLIPLNINTETETIVEEFTKGLDDFEKSIKNATKGMNFKTMAEEAEKLGLSFEDYSFKDGKYYINDYIALSEKLLADQNANMLSYITELDTRLTNVKTDHANEDPKELLKSEMKLSDEAIKELEKEFLADTDKLSDNLLDYYFEQRKDKVKNSIGEAQRYSKDMLARSALESGRFQDFAQLAMGVDENGNWIWDLEGIDKEAILSAIASGDISSLADEQKLYFEQYNALIISTYGDILKNIASSLFGALNGGTSRILVTEANKALLERAQAANGGMGWISDGELKVGEYAQIAVATLESNEEDFMQWLLTTYDNESDKIKAIKERHNHKYENTTLSALDKVLGKESFSYSDYIDYLSSTGKKAQDLTEEQVASLMQSSGLKLNAAGEVIVSDIKAWIDDLNSQLESLKTNPNASRAEINNVKAKLDDAQNMLTRTREEAVIKLVLNYLSFSSEDLEQFATAFDEDFDVIKSKIAIDNKNGTYSLNVTAILELLKGEEISEATRNTLSELISGIADNYLNAVSSASNYVTKGTTKLTDILKFTNDYNTKLNTSFNAGQLFEWDDILSSYILKPEYLLSYIEALRVELKEKGFDDEFINKYIKNLIDTIRLAVDISGFLSAENKSVSGKAYTSLKRSMLSYLYSQELKSEILEDYLEQAFSEADEDTSAREIAEVYVELAQEYNKNRKVILDSQIETDITALKAGGEAAIDVMRQYSKDGELSLKDIEAAYRAEIGPLSDLMSKLGDLEKGSIVSQEQIKALTDAGFTVSANGVVTVVGDLVQAYKSIYDAMAATGEATTSELNSAAAQVLNAPYKKALRGVEALNKGVNMSWKDLTQMYTDAGKTFGEYTAWTDNGWHSYKTVDIASIEREKDQLVKDGLISINDAGQITIEDIYGLAAKLGWDTASAQFKAAYDSFVESKAEEKDKYSLGKIIVSRLLTLASTKVGDNFGTTQLRDNLLTNLTEEQILLFTDLGIDVSAELWQITSEDQRTRLVNLLASIAETYKGVDKEVVQAFITELKEQSETTAQKKYTSTSELISKEVSMDSAKAFMKAFGQSTDTELQVIDYMTNTLKYKYNSWTGMFEADNKTLDSINALIKALETTEDGADHTAELNKLRALAKLLKYNLDIGDLQAALLDMVQKYTDFSYEAFADLEKLFPELDLKAFVSENGKGAYKVDVQGLIQYLKLNKIIISDAIEESIQGTFDDYSSAILNAVSLTSQGTTSLKSMREFATAYKDAGLGELDTSVLFEYNKILDAWTLKPEYLKEYVAAQAEKLGLLGEKLTDYVNSITSKTLAEAVDIDSFLEAENLEKSGIAYLALELLLTNYYKSLEKSINPDDYLKQALLEVDKELAETGESTISAKELATIYADEAKEFNEAILGMTIDLAIATISKGGPEAVNIAQKLAQASGKELTTELMQKYYAPLAEKYSSMVGQIVELAVGQYVTGDIRAELEAVGAVDDNGVITSVQNMALVYKNIYDKMKDTAGRTTALLNTVYASYLTSNEQKEIDAISVLGDAMGMTYDSLGLVLNNYGILLEDVAGAWDQYGIELIGNGKIRINDFKAFAGKIGLKGDSEEYTAAFKAYNDSLIALDRKTEKSIYEEINKITSAKGGERINLTDTQRILDKNLSEEAKNTLTSKLAAAGASLADGILVLSENADIAAAIDAIVSLDVISASLLPEELAELQDAVNALLTNIVGLIKNGISGTLSQKDASTLATFADKRGNGLKLDFTKTADGLKLSTKSAMSLYLTMKSVDELLARSLLPEISKMSSNYDTLQHACERYNELIKSNTESLREEKAVLDDLIKSMMTSPESYNFMSGSELPTSWKTATNIITNALTAVDKLNKASKSSFIELLDFYNIVSAAGQYNKDFNLNGMSATDLINKASSAITTKNKKVGIDLSGKGLNLNIQDLRSIYNQLRTGLLDMGNEAMAYYEIGSKFASISDAVNRITPIDFSKLFSVDESGRKSANIDEFKAYFDLLNAAAPSLFSSIENVMIHGQSLAKVLLSGNWDEWQKIGFNEDSFTQFMQGIREIDWTDLALAATNVTNLFSKMNLKAITIPFDPNTFIHFSASGKPLTIDLNDKLLKASVVKGYNEFIKDPDIQNLLGSDAATGKNITALLLNVAEQYDNPEVEFTTKILLRRMLALASGEINPSNFKYNKDGTLSYTHNGKTYTVTGAEGKNDKNAIEDLSNLITQAIMVEDEGFTVETVTEGEIIATKSIRGIIVKVTLDNKTGSKTYEGNFNGVPVTGTTYQEFLQNMMKEGVADESLVGQEVTMDNGEKGVIRIDSYTGLIYTRYVDSDGNVHYKFEGKDFSDYGTFREYINLRNEFSGDIEDSEDKTTRTLHVGENLDIVFDLTGETDPVYKVNGKEVKNKSIFKAWQEAEGADDFEFVDTDTDGLKATYTTSEGIPITMEMDTEGNITYSYTDKEDNTFTANSQAGYENMLKGIMALNGGDLGNVNGDGYTVHMKNGYTLMVENGEVKVVWNGIPGEEPTEIPEDVQQKKKQLEDSLKVSETGTVTTDIKVTGVEDATAAVTSLSDAITSLVGLNYETNLTVHIHKTEDGNGEAAGNVDVSSVLGLSFAGGTPTLMGELGPELVVSHGRYFVVGTNGAEMVPLDKDAIVFNHIQTRLLLNNGKTGRGTPTTNERTAAGMATGNVHGGPAHHITGSTPLNGIPTMDGSSSKLPAAVSEALEKLALNKKGKLASTLSDMISKGFKLIDWTAVEKELGATITNQLKKDAKDLGLRDLVKAYAKYGGKTTKEMNDMYFQAWEKEQGVNSEEYQNAIEGLTFHATGAITGKSSDWSTILALHDLFIGDIQKEFLDWNATTKEYIMKAGKEKDFFDKYGFDFSGTYSNISEQITDYTQDIYDNIHSLGDSVKSALSEGLDPKSKTEFLNALATEGISTEGLNWTETANGWILDKASALKLIEEILKNNEIPPLLKTWFINSITDSLSGAKDNLESLLNAGNRFSGEGLTKELLQQLIDKYGLTEQDYTLNEKTGKYELSDEYQNKMRKELANSEESITSYALDVYDNVHSIGDSLGKAISEGFDPKSKLEFLEALADEGISTEGLKWTETANGAILDASSIAKLEDAIKNNATIDEPLKNYLLSLIKNGIINSRNEIAGLFAKAEKLGGEGLGADEKQKLLDDKTLKLAEDDFTLNSTGLWVLTENAYKKAAKRALRAGKITLKEYDEAIASLADALREYAESSISFLENGLKGDLSSLNKNELKEAMEKSNLNTEGLKFKETSSGTKITRSSIKNIRELVELWDDSPLKTYWLNSLDSAMATYQDELNQLAEKGASYDGDGLDVNEMLNMIDDYGFTADDFFYDEFTRHYYLNSEGLRKAALKSDNKAGIKRELRKKLSNLLDKVNTFSGEGVDESGLKAILERLGDAANITADDFVKNSEGLFVLTKEAYAKAAKVAYEKGKISKAQYQDAIAAMDDDRQEAVNSIASSLESAFKGTLTKLGLNDLNRTLNKLGITDIRDKYFTDTVDGTALKLKGARSLLKKINSSDTLSSEEKLKLSDSINDLVRESFNTITDNISKMATEGITNSDLTELNLMLKNAGMQEIDETLLLKTAEGYTMSVKGIRELMMNARNNKDDIHSSPVFHRMMAVYEDTILTMVNSAADSISNLSTGSLSNDDLRKLNITLSNLGLKKINSKYMIKTADGLLMTTKLMLWAIDNIAASEDLDDTEKLTLTDSIKDAMANQQKELADLMSNLASGAISNADFSKLNAYLTANSLTGIADEYVEQTTEGIIVLADALRALLSLVQKKKGDTVEGKTLAAKIQDALDSLLASIVDLMSKASEGSITNLEFEELNAYLKANNLSEITNDLLTHTANGIIINYEALIATLEEANTTNGISSKTRELLERGIEAVHDKVDSLISDVLNNKFKEWDDYALPADLLKKAYTGYTQGYAAMVVALADQSNLTTEQWFGNLIEAIKKDKGVDLGLVADDILIGIEKLRAESADAFGKIFDKQELIDLYKAGAIEVDLTGAAIIDRTKATAKLGAERMSEISSILDKGATSYYKQAAEYLKETDYHYETMESTLARIKELQEKIKEISKYDDEKLEKYKEELALAQEELAIAKEIAAARATSEDESFSFLSRDIPGGLQNPQNYMKDWTSFMTNLTKAKDSDVMDFNDMYNAARHMNEVAYETGNAVNFLGATLDGSDEALTKVVNAMTNALGWNEDGTWGVILSKMGEDMVDGANTYSGDVDSTIHSVAKSLEELIDALILMFEAIVAMEEFDGLDKDSNGLLNLEELFEFNGDEATNKLKVEALTAAQNILEAAGKDSELNKALETVKINGYTLKEYFEDAADGIIDTAGMTAESWQTAVSMFYEAAKSGNYDLNNISDSLIEVIRNNASKFEGVIELPNGVLYSVKADVKIRKTADGKYMADGDETKYDTPSEAVLRAVLKDMDNVDLNTIEHDATNKVTTADYKLGETVVKIIESDTATTYEYKGTSYKTREELTQAIFAETNPGKTAKENESDYEHWKIEQGITIVPILNVDTIDTSNYTSQLKDELTGKTLQLLQEEWTKDPIDFKFRYNFSLEEKDENGNIVLVTEEQLEALKNKIGIETKRIELTAVINKITVNGDESGDIAGAIKQMIDIGDGISIPVTIDLEDFITKITTLLNTLTELLSSDSFNLLLSPYVDITDAVLQTIDLSIHMENTLVDPNMTAQLHTGEAKSKITDLSERLEKLSNTNPNITVSADTESAASLLSEIISQLASIQSKSVTVTTTYVTEEQTTTSSDSGSTSAKGNVALAAGTLMGELGPELWVSNGHYFIAGSNGAEFVDLPDDAIVFNHLQTANLLSKGHASRGVPYTNEVNAVSYAKGTGPAAANANLTLNTLKLIKAMWQSLETLSIQDLVTSVGGKDNKNNKVGSWIKDVERWYNLLLKIARLEKEINLYEAERSAIASSRTTDGEKYYELSKSMIVNYQLQADTLKELSESYKERFELRRLELNSIFAPISQFYTYDKYGQLQYKEGGLEKLLSIVELDNYGHAKSPEEQYKLMLQYGLGDYMKYDSSGKAIVASDYEDNMELFYYDAVLAGWERMEAEREEIQNLYNAYHDAAVDYYNALEKVNLMILEIIDNLITLENKVLDAIEERELKVIDNMTDLRSALSNSVSKYIDKLSNALSNERKLYDNAENANELTRLLRLLSILLRSGGSASEIANLQKEIDSRNKENYFNVLLALIDNFKEASDLLLEKMLTLIDLMTEALQYLKDNGLFWNEVSLIMAAEPKAIVEFITSNVSSWRSLSGTETINSLNELNNIVSLWKSYMNDDDMRLIKEKLDAEIMAATGLSEPINAASSTLEGVLAALGNAEGGGVTDSLTTMKANLAASLGLLNTIATNLKANLNIHFDTLELESASEINIGEAIVNIGTLRSGNGNNGSYGGLEQSSTLVDTLEFNLENFKKVIGTDTLKTDVRRYGSDYFGLNWKEQEKLLYGYSEEWNGNHWVKTLASEKEKDEILNKILNSNEEKYKQMFYEAQYNDKLKELEKVIKDNNISATRLRVDYREYYEYWGKERDPNYDYYENGYGEYYKTIKVNSAQAKAMENLKILAQAAYNKLYAEMLAMIGSDGGYLDILYGTSTSSINTGVLSGSSFDLSDIFTLNTALSANMSTSVGNISTAVTNISNTLIKMESYLARIADASDQATVLSMKLILATVSANESLKYWKKQDEIERLLDQIELIARKQGYSVYY